MKGLNLWLKIVDLEDEGTSACVDPTVQTAHLLISAWGCVVKDSETVPQFCREKVLQLINEAWAPSPGKLVLLLISDACHGQLIRQ